MLGERDDVALGRGDHRTFRTRDAKEFLFEPPRIDYLRALFEEIQNGRF